MIKVNDLYFSYPKTDIILINDLSIEFESGKLYSVFGDSGSGKSTLLALLGGLLQPTRGSVEIDGQVLSAELNKEDSSLIRRTLVSYIFQNYMLLPYLNAVENVQLAVGISNNVSSKEDSEILGLLAELGIDETTALRKVKKMSGGEQQRVAIARSLMCESQYILADEPSGNLDKNNTINLMKLFRGLVRDRGLGIIIVTHSDLVRSATDLSYELHEGKLRAYQEETIEW